MAGQDSTSRFNEIYNSTHKEVLTYVTAKCGNTADIQDIVQETYMELYTLLEKRGVDYVRNGKALVLRLAKQKLYRYYSLLERLRMFVPMTVTNGEGVESALSDLEADAFLTEVFSADQILLDEVRAFIRQKPAEVKKVFYLFYDVGLTIPETAKALSMSESKVKHKLYRTLKELRALFQGKEADPQ
ncbi:MAG: RNA polymerase sigma factor [Oscillospiraceae bacterium]|nr:RNA polymerase sigma factor [Oscillospiraceae bacterium]